MRIGRVGTDGDACVRVRVRGKGAQRNVEAVLDTGFNGFLALPVAMIEALDLDPLGSEEMILATGERRRVPTYDATVELGAVHRRAEVVEAGEPLVGTALLRGCDLHIRYVDGGRVELEELS